MKNHHKIPMVLTVLASVLLTGVANAANVAKLEEKCAACHGKDGVSTESAVPSIHGMSNVYIEYNLNAFKNSERPCADTAMTSGPDKGTKTNMCEVAKDLGDGDIKQIAKVYDGKKFVPAVQNFDAELATKGKVIHEANCEKCHSNVGRTAEDDAGILAGQWTPYLREMFQGFRAGKREMEKSMKPKIMKLTETDIEALLNYYASVK